MDEQFEFVSSVEAADDAWRISTEVIPQVVLVAVGVEDHWALGKKLFESVGVHLGLAPSGLNTRRGALCLDHGQRLAVSAPQDIVGKTGTGRCGKTGDPVFPDVGFVEVPTGRLEVGIDEICSSAVFVPVLAVQGAVFGRLCLGDLALELGDLYVLFGRDAFEVTLRLCEFSVLGAELLDESGQFLRAQRCRTSGEFGIGEWLNAAQMTMR